MNILILGDKNVGEILPYEVEFDDRLLVGETITEAFVHILVFSGDDSDPDDMLVGDPSISTDLTSILFNLQGGVAGAIYTVVVSAAISSNNFYMKTGHLAVVASDPFAAAS